MNEPERIARPRRRGTTLVEVLVAMAILAFVMLGVLQVFSLSLAQSNGSASRTHLSFKCQQVIEVLRTAQYVAKQDAVAYGASRWATDGKITFPLTAGTTTALPYDDTDKALWRFWGPQGANIVERVHDAYRLYYTVDAVGTTGVQVRVTAYPANAPKLPAGTSGTPAHLYAGKNSNMKVVEYVAQISNS